MDPRRRVPRTRSERARPHQWCRRRRFADVRARREATVPVRSPNLCHSEGRRVSVRPRAESARGANRPKILKPRMPLLEILTSSGFASLLGMRHALEPDHIAAVTTLVSREQSSYRAAWLGVCWGIGHTLMLFVVGLGLVLVHSEIPPSLADVFEMIVAAMLIALGLRSMLQAVQLGSNGPSYLHRHRRIIHQHPGVPAHVHIGNWTFARRPLIV